VIPDHSPERIELDLAFARHEISAKQYATALERSNSQSYHMLGKSLADACRAGQITITINK